MRDLRLEIDDLADDVLDLEFNIQTLDEEAPRMPQRAAYQGSLGQAHLLLRKAVDALREARDFLPDE